MLKKLVAIFITIVLVLQMNCLIFGTNLQSQQSELQDKIKEADNERKEVKSELSDTLKEVEDISSSIEENEDKISDINSQLTKLNKEIKDLQKNLDETQKKYTEQEEFLKEKLIIQYESGKTTYLDVLLNSKSMLDFISKYYLVSEVLQNDSDLLDSIEEQKNKIEKDKKSVEEKQKEIKTQKAEQEKISVVLANQKSEKQNKVSKLSSEEKELSSKIDKYKEEERKINAQILAQTKNFENSHSGREYTGGTFKWPCPNYSYLSSPFGYRICPYHGKELHSGLDMAAPYGSPILAAADGIVSQAGFVKSYGNKVVISHGSGLSTMYAHCSSILVSAGQKVSKGDVIARVGSTGDSTGNHLHFSVILNGNFVSPNSYLGM